MLREEEYVGKRVMVISLCLAGDDKERMIEGQVLDSMKLDLSEQRLSGKEVQCQAVYVSETLIPYKWENMLMKKEYVHDTTHNQNIWEY